MPPEHTPELLAKIDLLLALAQKQDERMGRVESRMDRMDDRIRLLEAQVAEFRGEMRGRLDGLAERISDVNARLPVPIAYSPPNKPAA